MERGHDRRWTMAFQGRVNATFAFQAGFCLCLLWHTITTAFATSIALIARRHEAP